MHRGWKRVRTKPHVQTYECEPYATEVVSPAPDMSELEAQECHAREQIELQHQYPGRGRHLPTPRNTK